MLWPPSPDLLSASDLGSFQRYDGLAPSLNESYHSPATMVVVIEPKAYITRQTVPSRDDRAWRSSVTQTNPNIGSWTLWRKPGGNRYVSRRHRSLDESGLMRCVIKISKMPSASIVWYKCASFIDLGSRLACSFLFDSHTESFGARDLTGGLFSGHGHGYIHSRVHIFMIITSWWICSWCAAHEQKMGVYPTITYTGTKEIIK